MAARDQVKTMATRTLSTVDAHPKFKEELHTCFLLLANTKLQATSYVAYNWTARPSKISPAQCIEPCISP